MTLYNRKKESEVEVLDDKTLIVHARMSDIVHEMEVDVSVSTEDLSMTLVEARMIRHPYAECPMAIPAMQKINGIQIRSGMNKKIMDAVGGPRGCTHLVDLVKEASTAALQSLFPLMHLRAGTNLSSEEMIRDVLEFIPEMVNTCMIYKEGSPLMQRVEASRKNGKVESRGGGRDEAS